MGVNWFEIFIIFVVVVLLFGRGKVSQLMGDVAKGLRSFKRGLAEDVEPVVEATATQARGPSPAEQRHAADRDHPRRVPEHA